MLALWLAILGGALVVVLAWHLLRAPIVVAVVGVLVLVGIGLVTRLKTDHGRAPATQVAALRHAASRDVRRLEHGVRSS